jgi:hypothetical protein
MKVLMNHQGNLGYGPDQVKGMTLDDLLAEVEQAIEDFGGDAEVIPHQTNNGRGANYGALQRFELFEPADVEDEEAEDRAHL